MSVVYADDIGIKYELNFVLKHVLAYISSILTVASSIIVLVWIKHHPSNRMSRFARGLYKFVLILLLICSAFVFLLHLVLDVAFGTGHEHIVTDPESGAKYYYYCESNFTLPGNAFDFQYYEYVNPFIHKSKELYYSVSSGCPLESDPDYIPAELCERN